METMERTDFRMKNGTTAVMEAKTNPTVVRATTARKRPTNHERQVDRVSRAKRLPRKTKNG